MEYTHIIFNYVLVMMNLSVNNLETMQFACVSYIGIKDLRIYLDMYVLTCIYAGTLSLNSYFSKQANDTKKVNDSIKVTGKKQKTKPKRRDFSLVFCSLNILISHSHF